MPQTKNKYQISAQSQGWKQHPHSPCPSAAEEWRGSPREERAEAYSVLTARSASQTPGQEALLEIQLKLHL